MSEELDEGIEGGQTDSSTVQTIQTPRPSSPRKFFARIYGHLEEPKTTSVEKVSGFESESSSDVEIGESEGVEMQARGPQLWPPPPPLPLCPRPMMLPHQQLAFGAGLAAFRKLFSPNIRPYFRKNQFITRIISRYLKVSRTFL